MSDILHQSYPKSRPFDTEQEFVAGGSRMQRWALLLAGAMALAVVGVTVAGVILVVRAHRQVESARTTLDEVMTAHLYQTYLNLTLLGDAAEGDIYTREDRDNLLDTVLGLLDSVDGKLNRMTESGGKKEEQESLQRFRQLSNLLRIQAGELRAYWRTGDKACADRFQQSREEAWAIIQELVDVRE